MAKPCVPDDQSGLGSSGEGFASSRFSLQMRLRRQTKAVSGHSNPVTPDLIRGPTILD